MRDLSTAPETGQGREAPGRVGVSYPSWACQGCGEWKIDHVHHIVHKRNGCECAVNKMGLCWECHAILHAVGRETFYMTKKPHLRLSLVNALEHRDARNRGELPCSPKQLPPRRM